MCVSVATYFDCETADKNWSIMQKKLCLVLPLTLVFYWAKASPTSGLGSLEFNAPAAVLADLDSYEEEDLDDYSQLLDDQDANSKAKTKTSGFKKKSTQNKGTKNSHNIQDLKNFFKIARVQDKDAFDDDEVYSVAEAAAAEAVGIKGNEDRTYRKGTKTRGFHRVHHKDEYKKDKVFYEDDETKGTIRKVGAKGLGVKIGAGAGVHKGHFHHDRRKGVYGKRGFLDKGFSNKEFKGYSDTQGFDGSFGSDA